MKVHQDFIIIVRQGLHEKFVEGGRALQQILKGVVGKTVQGAGGFGDDEKLLGVFPVGPSQQLVEPDDAPGIKIELDGLLPPVRDAGEGADPLLQKIEKTRCLAAVLDI